MADQEDNFLPLNDLSSQFLECPLCLSIYVNPKVLPCQHTFCLDCLKRYVEAREDSSNMPCPVCRENIEIPGEDVTNLKNNFFIHSLMNFASRKKIRKDERTASIISSSDESLCGACGESETLSAFCPECSLELCNTCTRSHGTFPATSSHDLLTSQQLDRKCKAKLEKYIPFLNECQNKIRSHHELLTAHTHQLPDRISDAQKCIESAAEEAHRLITTNTSALLQEVENFQADQDEMVSQEMNRLEEEKQRLAKIEELLASISLTDDGFKNQKSLKQVETFVADTSNAKSSPLFGKILNIKFFAESDFEKSMDNVSFGNVCIFPMTVG